MRRITYLVFPWRIGPWTQRSWPSSKREPSRNDVSITLRLCRRQASFGWTRRSRLQQSHGTFQCPSTCRWFVSPSDAGRWSFLCLHTHWQRLSPTSSSRYATATCWPTTFCEPARILTRAARRCTSGLDVPPKVCGFYQWRYQHKMYIIDNIFIRNVPCVVRTKPRRWVPLRPPDRRPYRRYW